MIHYSEKFLKSKYKNLVVSGCSFTCNEHESHVTWGNTLAYWTGMNISNHGINGAGSSHIANSLILYLEKNKPDPADTLIIAMWSSLARVDWITDIAAPKDYNYDKHTYHYDNYNELNSLLTYYNNKGHFLSTATNYRKYQSDLSYALGYWLDVQSLSSYLDSRGYKYFYTSIYDLDARSGLDKLLSKIDLTLDKTNWLNLSTNNYLGSYAILNKMVASDGWHPTVECQELWTQNILVPELMNKDIISK